jgi:tetratricopeptide (TPR) repeat protein
MGTSGEVPCLRTHRGRKLLDHPSIETLAKLLAGDLSHEELLTEVLPHFFERCPDCQGRHQEILRLQHEFGHWDERVAVWEGRQAPELFAALRDLPFDEQLSLVADDETFQTWGLCQLLLRESLDAASEDACRAVNFAELGVKVSQSLGDAYDPNWVLDLRARASAYLGNAQRVLGELRSAETAFREAEGLLTKSTTGNELIEAEVIHLKSSLRRAQRRLEDAMSLVERALTLYREHDDSQGMGVALVSKAKILEESGRLTEAVTALRQAVAIADPHSRLGLYARHNLLLCLTLAGNYEEASHLLSEIRGDFERSGRPLDLLRLQWTEGKIALGSGRPQEAEEAFLRVQEAFLARGMGYDAALVSLDLAILYVRDRRTEDLRRLAVEILQVFESRDVHREAVAALILFRSACEEERLTVELAGQIATLLQRERRSK